MTLSKYLLVALAASLAGVASAAPYPHGTAPAAVDLGDSAAVEGNAKITVTVALKLNHAAQLESLLESVYTQGSPQYHQFLTPGQFREQFGPSADTIAAVTKEFAAQGLAVTQSATAQLHLTGTAAQIEKAFGVQLHSYAVPASAGASAYRYHAPVTAPQLPAAVAASLDGVLGLDTRPRMSPHLRSATKTPQPQGSGANGLPDPFGSLTVVDFAQQYNINPLYRRGIDGSGRTIAIITLANFTPSDAFAYWDSLGLKVARHRITVVQVDGGPGAPSDDSGSLETTLDVEQSGGIAPAAKIIVYMAPNTSQAFVDAFAQAIDDNKADTMSTSWGEWEVFDGSNPCCSAPVSNPVTGTMTSVLAAYNDLLIQAALQGQSMFAAAGDGGAWDEVGELPPNYSNVISVDDPAAQPFLTAAGGTTLPGPQVYGLPNGSTLTINLKEERAWGWDYLEPLCAALHQTIAECGIFPGGGGGGVSIYLRRPFYQEGVPGMADTVRGQALYDDSQAPPLLILRLPAGFPGRNVPDISLNSDPQTGYVIAYTSSSTGFSFETFWGGTSFASPQMNGVTSLLSQGTHGRVGLLNVPLYWLASRGNGYHGPGAPLRDIKSGDNWYWYARPGYDQASGVGVPNVANLLDALRDLGF